MPDETLPSKELVENITKIIENHGIEDFSEAKEWLIKSGLGIENARETLIKKIVEILSQYLSRGLLQLTIEEIAKEKEYKDAVSSKKEIAIVAHLSKNLPLFKAYLEFIVKSGSIEIKKIRYDFKVESEIEAKDAQAVVQEKRIKSISFGSLIASVTLYLVKDDRTVKIGNIKKVLSLPGPITLIFS